MKHETLWNTSNLTEAAPESDRLTPCGEKLSFSGSKDWRFIEFCGEMESSLSAEGEKRTSAQTRTGSAFMADGFSKEEVAEIAGKRAAGSWLSHRPLDIKAYWRNNRETFWHPLLYRQSLEVNDCVPVELPETGKESEGEKRNRHSFLDTLSVAPYKKKLKKSGLTWSSSMKVDFCWYQLLQKPGHQKGRLPLCKLQETGARFLPSPQSVFLQKENDWRFTSNFISIKTSVPDNWLISSDISCDILKNRYSFFGTEAGCINQNLFNASWIVIPEFTRTTSRVTPRNSIPMNLSGHNLKKPLPMVFPITYCNLKDCSTNHCESYSVLRNYCGLVSLPQNYRGSVSIT